MAKQSRRSRTNVAEGGLSTLLPSVSGQMSPGSARTPSVDYPGGEAVLGPRAVQMDNLNAAFSRFFGQVSAAADAVQSAIAIGERQRIEQENEAQKSQAVSDFYAGKEMALPDDNDYYTTYTSLLASRTAFEAAVGFEEWYRTDFAVNNPMGDLDVARQEYMREHIIGQSDDPMLEAQVLAGFVKGTEELLATHRESSIKLQIANGKDNLAATINADAKNGAINPDRIPFYIQSYKTVDPLAQDNAAPWVADQIQVAIRNNPEQTMAILDVLSKPGTGIGDKSFAESFPEAYAEVQTSAVQDWAQIGSMQEWEIIDGFRTKLRTVGDMDESDLNEFAAEVIAAKQQYGIAGPANEILDQIATAADKLATSTANMGMMDDMSKGARPIDPPFARENFDEWLAGITGTPNFLEADPKVVAEAVSRFHGTTGEGFKTNLSAAMLSFENPGKMMAAIELVNQISGFRGPEFALGILDDNAERAYRQVQSMMELGTGTPEQAIARVYDIRRRMADKDFTWADFGAGKTPTEAQATARQYIQDSLEHFMGGGGMFGTSLKIDPSTLASVEEYALLDLAERGGEGIDWKTALIGSMGRLAARADVLPQPGGYMISLDTNARPVTWIDGSGNLQERIKMGLYVRNPNTGETVNTVQVYENDLSITGKLFPSIFTGGDTDAVALYDDPNIARYGGYALKDDGVPMIMELGDEFDVPVSLGPPPVQVDPLTGETIASTVPGADPLTPVTDILTSKKVKIETEADLIEAFEKLPDGFFLVEVPTSAGKTGYQLGYRPNFGENAGMTLDERIIQYDNKP